MPAPYFQRAWDAFVYQGNTYDLSHLDEYEIAVTDSMNVERRIAITFHDHCFTRKPDSVDLALVYPNSDRNPGHFCFERYTLSFGLKAHVATATTGNVWNVNGDNYAIVPTIDHRGDRVLYGIVFSLDPVTGLPVHLHMRIKTAYPVDEKPLATFGFLKFRNLVTLRMQKKKPRLISDQHRKRPAITEKKAEK